MALFGNDSEAKRRKVEEMNAVLAGYGKPAAVAEPQKSSIRKEIWGALASPTVKALSKTYDIARMGPEEYEAKYVKGKPTVTVPGYGEVGAAVGPQDYAKSVASAALDLPAVGGLAKMATKAPAVASSLSKVFGKLGAKKTPAAAEAINAAVKAEELATLGAKEAGFATKPIAVSSVPRVITKVDEVLGQAKLAGGKAAGKAAEVLEGEIVDVRKTLPRAKAQAKAAMPAEPVAVTGRQVLPKAKGSVPQRQLTGQRQVLPQEQRLSATMLRKQPIKLPMERLERLQARALELRGEQPNSPKLLELREELTKLLEEFPQEQRQEIWQRMSELLPRSE